MNSRPNLPVALLVVAAVCFKQSAWAIAEVPAGDAKPALKVGGAQPAQKPVAGPTPPATPAGYPANAPAKAPTNTAKAPAVSPPAIAPPAQPAAPLPTDPVAVLRMARERLTGTHDKQSANDVQTIRARIVERVSISGRKFRLEGTYLQGTDLRLRLDLKVIADAPESRVEGSLLEVCNGTILWAIYQVGNETRITRRDVSQILNASKTNGQINFSTVELGLGGLPALLASLDRSMKFESVTQEQIKDKKFTVLAGSWKDDRLKDLLNKMSKQHLPEHVPDSVRIYLDAESLFPRRIAFLKHHGSQLEPLVEFDLLAIELNDALDEHQFEYSPPDGARPVDVTTDYVKQVQDAGF